MKRKVLPLTILSLLLCGCTLFCPGCRNNSDKLTIMTWNVENLFDDIDNGTEYQDFIPGEENWTAEDFHGKMANLSEAIKKLIPGGPDILLLQEVENDNVLEIFGEEYLDKMDYYWRVFSKNEGMAAGTGVLSRLPIEKTVIHRFENPALTPGRPILEVWVEKEEESLVLFNNHWKSKSGGAEETEQARREAAGIINRRVAELLADQLEMSIIIAGDLNENPDEDVKCSFAYPTALSPLENYTRNRETFPDKDPALTLWHRSLTTSGYHPEVSGPPAFTEAGLPLFFTLWDSDTSNTGSYYYRENWEKIDHFFLSSSLADGKNLEFMDFRLCSEDFLLYTGGGPVRWDRDRGEGYSDHLPLIVSLSYD